MDVYRSLFLREVGNLLAKVLPVLVRFAVLGVLEVVVR
jgi:hypothetical protein